MTGRRLLPLVVGVLWAVSGPAQAQLAATKTLYLDGGTFYTRAYPVYVDPQVPYVMASGGNGLQVFDINGTEVGRLAGIFDAFAVLNGLAFGAATATLVTVSSNEPTCGGTRCLRAYRWDPVNGFQSLGVTTTTSVTTASMALQGGTTAPISVLYSDFANNLFEWAITIDATGALTFGSVPSNRSLSSLNPQPTPPVLGMAPSGPNLYLTAVQSALYTVPSDVTNLDGGVFATMAQGGFQQLDGLFLGDVGQTPTLIAGARSQGVLFLDPAGGTPIVMMSCVVTAAASDGGTRTTVPSAASVIPDGGVLIVSETHDPLIGFGDLPVVYIVQLQPDGGCDGGTGPPPTDAGGGTGSGGRIPSVPPGPGLDIAPSGGCSSTVGLAPLFLALLVPLAARRRRR